MALIKGSIGLEIRERHSENNLSQYNPESIRRWVADLPKANIGETSRQVYHRLLESNTQLLNTKVRMRILGSLEESVHFVCEYMTRHYTIQSAFLTDKQMKVANLSSAIQLEAAIGYKTIIEELLNDEKFGSDLLPVAVNYALYYFHKVQILIYQLYLDLPSGLWHEIHLLYQLAEQNQFHEKRVPVANNQVNTQDTYKKIVLLATANCNKLRQRDIGMVAKSLPTLMKNCSLSSDPDTVCDFVTNLNTDAPPFHRSLVEDGMKAHYRGFNLQNIVNFLQQELKISNNKNSKVELDDIIHRHLLRSWETMATRVFARNPSSDGIQVSLGLAASHYLINNELYGENQSKEEQDSKDENLIDALEGSLKGASIISDDDHQMYQGPKTRHSDLALEDSDTKSMQDSIWDSVYSNQESLNIVDDRKPYKFMDKSTKKSASQYNYQDATLINVSPGGYCLKLSGKLPKQTQAGEIIGILEHHDNKQAGWNIGNICWIKRQDTGDLQLGVQLIAPNAIPVFAQERSSVSDKHIYQRCLLLPVLPGIGQPQTILTSTIRFSLNHKVRIKEQDETYDVILTKLITYGHSFQQFEYEKLQGEISEDKKDSATDDFDSVWELL